MFVLRHLFSLMKLSWFCRNPDCVEPGVGKWVSYLNREKKLDLLVGPRPTAPPAPKGLYIYGNVGSGLPLHLTQCLIYHLILSHIWNLPHDPSQFQFHARVILAFFIYLIVTSWALIQSCWWGTKTIITSSREDYAHGHVLWCHRRNCSTSKTASLSWGKCLFPYINMKLLPVWMIYNSRW